MKPFLICKINEIVGGTLIKGSEDLIIRDATMYLKTLRNPNTLIFLKTTPFTELDIIKRYTPCAVITDADSEQLKSLDGCTIIKVYNLQASYWKFVDYYRSLFNIPVIAVTGTSGKSTTKDMVKHILKYSFNVQGTKASANGRTGHLTYLLRIDDDTDVAVFETAVGRQGDITYGCRHFKPIIGIITNIGIDHLDECKTIEGYVQAKAEMLTAVKSDGIMIINSDDENIKMIELQKFKGRIVSFGIKNTSDFQASEIKFGDNCMEFILMFHQMRYKIVVPGYGEHQVYNSLAALAAVHELGIGINEASEQLRTFKNLPSHLQSVNGMGGCIVLDDTWSLNPTSLKAALQALNGIAGARKKVAMIGTVNTLGELTSEICLLIGDMVAEIGPDILITIGPTGEIIARQAADRGFIGQIKAFQNTSGLYEFLKDILDQNTILLAKCSMFDSPFKELVKTLVEQSHK